MPETLPEQIGKYPVMSELGRGATSRVYLGRDPLADRDVAIKVLRPEPGVDPEVQRRFNKSFMNEAALIGRLIHPHIVQIFDANVTDDYSYIVMEYAPGDTLEEQCSLSNLMPMDAVVEAVFKCSLALDYASRQGVIHRDIKPANILRGAQSEIKISDFGAAQLETGEQTVMQGMGSPAYMSPEQVLEKPLDHQTDIYSLGVVMYQLLTGRLPFYASNRASLVYQITNMDPTPPSVHRADLPKPLETLVLRAIAKDPAERFKSWSEFSRELAQTFRHLELPADNISDTQKYEAIRSISFFKEFSEVEAWEVVRISSWHRHPAGKDLLKEGETETDFYLLVDGEAKVKRSQQVVGKIQSGDCFGELLYFEEQHLPRSTTVTSASDITVIKITAEALRKATDALQKQVNKSFLRILINRLAKISDRQAAVP
jgi:serine/threonine protein kinase